MTATLVESEVLDTVRRLLEIDPAVQDRDGMAEYTRLLKAHRGWLDAREVAGARRQRELAKQGAGESPKDLFARHGGKSGRDARAADEREQVCTAMPGFEAALAAGSVAAGHVDAIAQATRNLDAVSMAEFVASSQDLLADAERMGVDVFERNCRDLARTIEATKPGASDADELDKQRKASKISRFVDKVTGMRHTRIELDPVRDAILHTALQRELKKLRREPGNAKKPWAELEVEALINAASNTGTGTGERVVQLLVLIDLETLLHGLHGNSVCELADGTKLPVSTVRQMACDAELIPVVLNGQGLALDVGRSQRLATAAQRVALQAMHTTCAFPGCDTPVEQTRAHHADYFSRGGLSNLANYVPLCMEKGHHTLVHEGGWTLTVTDDRIGTFTLPDGTTYWTGPLITRAPNGVARTPAESEAT